LRSSVTVSLDIFTQVFLFEVCAFSFSSFRAACVCIYEGIDENKNILHTTLSDSE